jgi:hypothetical protein
MVLEGFLTLLLKRRVLKSRTPGMLQILGMEAKVLIAFGTVARIKVLGKE